MRISAETFWVQKSGSAATEYEDAFWPLKPLYEHPVSGQISLAVADGATESSYSSIWARQLARSYVRDQWFHSERFDSSFKKIQGRWDQIVGRKPKSWYAEQKLEQGAFGAFLGMTFFEGRESGLWSLMASGDCCMVQVRDNQPLRSLPFTSSEDFDSRPILLGTRRDVNDVALSQLVRVEGEWEEGDQFFLMTDALAAWFLRQVEDGGQPWIALQEVAPDGPARFPQFIDENRSTKRLRNDDVTLLWVTTE
jgi:hypothetical protein